MLKMTAATVHQNRVLTPALLALMSWRGALGRHVRGAKNDSCGTWCICDDLHSVGSSEGRFTLRGNSIYPAERGLVADQEVPIQGRKRAGRFSGSYRW